MDSSPYLPPARKSMSDAELADAVGQNHPDEAGTLAAMELLEQQAILRSEDNAARSAWEAQMRSEGSAEAQHALENASRVDRGEAPVEYVAPAPDVVEPVVELVAEPPVELAVADAPVVETPVAEVPVEAVLEPVVAVQVELQPDIPDVAVPSVAEAIEVPVPVAPNVVPEQDAPSDPRTFDLTPYLPAVIGAPITHPTEVVEQDELGEAAVEPEVAPDQLAADVAVFGNTAPVDLQPEPVAVEQVDIASKLNQLHAEMVAASTSEVELPVEPVASISPEPEEVPELVVESPAPDSLEAEEQPEFATSISSIEIDEPAIEAQDDRFEAVLSGSVEESTSIYEEEHPSSTASVPLVNPDAELALPKGRGVWSAAFATYFPNSVVATLVAAAATLALGSQSPISSVLGIAMAALVAGLLTAVQAVAGNRAKLSSRLISRAAFGVYGNIIPALKLFAVRVAAIAALAAILAPVMQLLFPNAGATFDLGAITVSAPLLAVVVLCILAALISALGEKVRSIGQGVLGAGAALGLIVYALTGVSSGDQLTLGSLEWPLVIQAAVLAVAAHSIFSLATAADESRLLKAGTSNRRVFWSSFMVSGVLGALVALVIGLGLVALPIGPNATSTRVLEYAVSACALLVAVVASQVKALALELNAIISSARHRLLQSLVMILVVAGAIALGTPALNRDLTAAIPDMLLLFSAPVVAFVGIAFSDSLLRRVDYHEISIFRSYGFYKKVNLTNLIGWALVTVGIVAFTPASVNNFFGILGFGLKALSIWPSELLYPLEAIPLGLLAAIAIPVVFGIGRIRKQEAEVKLVDARRTELDEVLGIDE